MPLDLVCDGHVDCPDASDEAAADCGRKDLSPYSIFHQQGSYSVMRYDSLFCRICIVMSLGQPYLSIFWDSSCK